MKRLLISILCVLSLSGLFASPFLSEPEDYGFSYPGISPAVSILDAENTGGELRLFVSFRPDFAGCPLVACTSASYGAEDVSAWTSTPLDPIGDAEHRRFFSVPYASGTKFFRLRTMAEDGIFWSETIVLENVRTISPATPTLFSGDVVSTTLDSATMTVDVAHPGEGCQTCDLVLVYGTDPSALVRTAAFPDKEVGTSTIALDGLVPATRYYAAFRAKNAAVTSQEPPVFTFQTQDFPPPDGSCLQVSLPGLWQGVFTNDTDGYMDTADKYNLAHADGVYRAPGAVMAYISNRTHPQGYSGSFDGTLRTFTWTGDTTYAYKGYIWLDATEYVFGAYFWDYVYLKIDDDLLFNQVITWGIPVCARTYQTAGWHRFELRGSNAGHDGDANNCGSLYGGAGDCYTAGSDIAISYSTNETMVATVKKRVGDYNDPGINSGTIPREGWSPFLDESGTFLRTANPLRSIAVKDLSTAGGKLSAHLVFGNDVPGAYELRIAYGAAHGGDSPSSWEKTESITTIAADTAAYDYSGIAGAGTTVKYARFYFTDGDSIRWGDNLYLPKSNN